MTLRDLFVFSVVFGSLPFCFTRPFYGLLMFSWLGYMRAQDLTWGMARHFRFSYYVAILMFVGYFFFEKRKFFRPDARTFCLIGLVIWVFLSIFHNHSEGMILYLDPVLRKSVDFIKVIAVALFTTGLVDNKKRLWLMVWVIAFSLGFFGVKSAIWGALTGGRIIEGPGGMLKDNNDFCLALNMNIPILYYLAFSTQRKNLRMFLLFAVACTAVTVVLTTSRGGFLTMTAIFFLLVLRSNKKMLGFGAGFVAAVIFVFTIPDDYVERIKTIKNPAEEASSKARLDSWASALLMIQDHPMTGVGFNNFINHFWRYDVNPDEFKGTQARVAHNTYLQLWAESGTPALLLFLGAIGISILRMRKLRRWNRRNRGPPWLTNYAHMCEISLVAFLVGAMFLNRAHFDLMYHMIAVSACLNYVAPQVLEEERPKGPRTTRGEKPKVKSDDPFLVPSGANGLRT